MLHGMDSFATCLMVRQVVTEGQDTNVRSLTPQSGWTLNDI